MSARVQLPRILVIGGGRMGSFHAKAVKRCQVFELVGVVDPVDPGWPGVEWEPDPARALEHFLPDAVVVAAPPWVHARLARASLEAGCHVLVEKPICPTAQEARALAEEFNIAGKVLFGGHSERYHPVFLKLREELARTGGWTRLRCVRQGPAPTVPPEGGAVLDLAIHDLDLAMRLAGDLVLQQVEMDNQGRIRSSLEGNGHAVSISVGYLPLRRRTWELETVDGIWRADFLSRTLEWHPRCGKVRILETGRKDALELEHAHFLAACRGNDWWGDLIPQIRAVELAREINGLSGDFHSQTPPAKVRRLALTTPATSGLFRP